MNTLPREELELEAAVEDALKEAEGANKFMKSLDDEQVELLVAPEKESNPQLYWPESNADGYDQRTRLCSPTGL
jgi:hypothetical protein